MKIAIPLVGDRLSPHFGHCERFALVEADEQAGKIASKDVLKAPAHQPGLLPRWLHEQGANVILAGGMGQRAQQLFEQAGIKVVIGVPSETPEILVAAYLNGTLTTGANICDH